MEYTYKYDIQGHDKTSHYLHMAFDRSLSTTETWHGGPGLAGATGRTLEFLKALSETPNVVTHGVVKVDGPRVTVAINPFIGDVSIPEIAGQIAKKVQTRFAKGETRKRVKFAVVEAKLKRLNARTWGE